MSRWSFDPDSLSPGDQCSCRWDKHKHREQDTPPCYQCPSAHGTCTLPHSRCCSGNISVVENYFIRLNLKLFEQCDKSDMWIELADYKCNLQYSTYLAKHTIRGKLFTLLCLLLAWEWFESRGNIIKSAWQQLISGWNWNIFQQSNNFETEYVCELYMCWWRPLNTKY